MGGFVEVGGGDVRAISVVAVLALTALPQLGYDRNIDLPGRGESSSEPAKHQGCGGRWVRRQDTTFECRRCGEVRNKPPETS